MTRSEFTTETPKVHSGRWWAVLHRSGNIVDVAMSFSEAKRLVKVPELERIVEISVTARQIGDPIEIGARN